MRAGAWVVVVVSSGCMVRGSAQTPTIGIGASGSAEPAAQEPGAAEPGAAEMSGAIEAGCSFHGGELKGEVGSEFEVSCPDGCATQGGSWGTEVYTIDSRICRAGIHSGAIPATGGVVHVRLEPGRPAYRGSARNGVESHDYGAYRQSFAVLDAKAAPAPRAAAAQAIEAGCSYSGAQVVGEVGTRVVVSCPAGCVGKGGAWGSDVYTIDSSVCLAGVHSGIIADQGGDVGVTIEQGRPAYRGSTRNGVQSYDYGAYRQSFRVSKP